MNDPWIPCLLTAISFVGAFTAALIVEGWPTLSAVRILL